MYNYEEKVNFLILAQENTCPISYGMLFDIELHHALIPNSKANRKKYPKFIDSVYNLMAVNSDAHSKIRSFGACLNEKLIKKAESSLPKDYENQISNKTQMKIFNILGDRIKHLRIDERGII